MAMSCDYSSDIQSHKFAAEITRYGYRTTKVHQEIHLCKDSTKNGMPYGNMTQN